MNRLTSIRQLNISTVNQIFEKAKVNLQQRKNKLPQQQSLAGKIVATLFYENSTRTLLSFEIAAKTLGAHVVHLFVQHSSTNKGEDLIATAQNIEAMGVDAFVIRHYDSLATDLIADNLTSFVVNAGDGTHEHPSQALLDCFTIKQKFGNLQGLKITILGDILHSRVARSNMLLLSMLGANVTLAGPKTLLPAHLPYIPLADAIKDADVVVTLRIQNERMNNNFIPSISDYTKLFGLDSHHLAFMKKDVFIMHPGPINRNVEISSFLVDEYAKAAILSQVENGVAIRQAIFQQFLV